MDEQHEISSPMGTPAMVNQSTGALIRCPYCGSNQFFGRRRVTTIGWVLYCAALLNLVLSAVLMFVFVGFCTIFLSPLLAIVGFHGCREHVNTCAACKRDF
jgi:hypothetical protein